MRLAAAMLRHLVRAVHWLPLLVVSPLVAAAGGIARLDAGELVADTALLLARTNGLLLGAAAAFTLADDMAGSTAALPSPRWLRQWLRTALATGFTAAAWTATYLLLTAWSARSPPLPEAALEAAACVLAGLAGAAVAVRRAPHRYGASGGAVVLALLFVASLFLPAEWSPWPVIGAPHWEAVHIGWLLAVPTSLAVLLLAHRDTRSG